MQPLFKNDILTNNTYCHMGTWPSRQTPNNTGTRLVREILVKKRQRKQNGTSLLTHNGY